MGFQKFKGHAGVAKNLKKRSSNCLSGGFYTSPTSGSTIDSLKPLNITWDTSCLSPSGGKVDIYLFAPAASNPRLHWWENVDYKTGYYEATLMPRWWNSTASEQLQLLILESGDAPFMATLPAGPVFTATYNTPSSGTPDSAKTGTPLTTADQITNAEAAKSSSSSSHISGGKIAAAVIVPLIVVGILCAFLYVRFSRAKGKAQRQRWSEKVDQRMSVVSTDWQSTTAAGAQAAIRNSMAIRDSMAIRASMAMEGDARLSMSQASISANLAGMGVKAPGDGVGGFFIPGQGDPTVNPIVSMPTPVMLPETSAPLRPGLRSSAYSNAAAQARVSRVSFAEPAIPGRVSGESRRSIYDRERPSFDSSKTVGSGTRRSVYSQYSQASRGSRAFHYSGDEDMPPMPEGAAERASQFYMLSQNANIGSAVGSHMNVSNYSSSSLDANRISRFDEVYGEDYSNDYSNDSYNTSYGQAVDMSRASSDDGSGTHPGLMSPTQTQGPIALSTDDIKRRISMRQGSKGSKKSFDSSPSPKTSFDVSSEDVGPALSMMRAQEQEYTSETLFSSSPSPDQATFPPFQMPMPMPSLAGATLPESPVMASTDLPSSTAPASSYTGMALPKNAMSPDDMLKAYAERKAAAASSAAGTGNGGSKKKGAGRPKISSPLQASVSYEQSEDGH